MTAKRVPKGICSECKWRDLSPARKGLICAVCLEVAAMIRFAPSLDKKEIVRDGTPCIVFLASVGGYALEGKPRWTEGNYPAPIVPKERDERYD